MTRAAGRATTFVDFSVEGLRRNVRKPSTQLRRLELNGHAEHLENLCHFRERHRTKFRFASRRVKAGELQSKMP